MASSLTAGFVLLFSFLMFSTIAYNSCASSSAAAAAADAPIPNDGRGTHFIETKCSNTTNPRLCLQCLFPYASKIGDSPEELVRVAIQVTILEAQKATGKMQELLERKDLKPKEQLSMTDCVELSERATAYIEYSLKEMDFLGWEDRDFHIKAIRIWLYGTLEDYDMCTETFDGKDMEGNVKDQVTKITEIIQRFINNAFELFIGNAAALA